MTGYLAHYGVKGMKWGVWNSETATRYGAKGGILPKGSVVTRVSTSKEDPLIIFNPDRNLAKDSVYYGKYWSPYGSDFAPKEKKTYD